MSIDFDRLQELSTPKGVVTKIEDLQGNVLWELSGGKIVLEVEKITSNTYAGEASYENEQFILLDIYPKTNGTVNITYGGLTKTITDTSGAETPNAQQVYFGTFNGVSDSVTTPASGELTIDGDWRGFACGAYKKGSKDVFSSYCSCITSVIKWGGMTSISGNAFYGCTGLTSINIPTSIRSVGALSFYGCTGLASVHITDFNAWCRIDFLVGNSNPLSNGGNLYVNDVLVTHVTLPSYAADMTYTFAGYQNLKTVSFQSGITGIGNGVFYDCDGLTSIELPNSLTSIGDYAFYQCANLALVSLPNSLTSIGDYAFSGCDGLTSIELPNSLASIGKFAFENCAGLTSVKLPNSLTSIGDYAFDDCYNLALTSLPSGLTSIGGHAFGTCYRISIGEIPEGVTYIGEYAFGMIASSTNSDTYVDNMPDTIILPSTIAEIGAYAFTRASASQVYPSNLFETVIIRATIPPTIGTGAFGENENSSYTPNKIIVPAGCGDAYKVAEGWSGYADVIVEES